MTSTGRIAPLFLGIGGFGITGGGVDVLDTGDIITMGAGGIVGTDGTGGIFCIGDVLSINYLKNDFTAQSITNKYLSMCYHC
jgi:hypothetical protein